MVELLERTLIEKTLERTGGNRSAASKRLGIHRNTLQRKMAEYHLGPRKARRKPVGREARARKNRYGVSSPVNEPANEMDLLIFDLDGTLIDSKLDLAHAVNATRGHMGMPPLEYERVYSYVGNGAPVLIRRVLGPDATEAQVQEALEFFLEYYRDHKLDYTVLYPGVREALDRLRDAGVQTGRPHQ